MATADPPAPAPSADAASLPAGYRMNEYVIDKPLGGGGFGITYLARDSNLDLTVAIKEYYPSDVVTRGADLSVKVRAGNEEVQHSYDWGLERFLDEARALAKFSHPNIVRVLRYFRENGTAYIVMEYESGLALKRWVPQNAPLTQRLLLSIIYPLLDGLEAVHKTGFLHRDIKPDNIYVRADGTPVLLDFGAARRVTANHDMTNIVSPGFAPFEQYHSQGNQGPWTDIYSLGAVMYWMTTGKKPVESASRVKNDPLLPASSLAEAAVFGADLLLAIEWAMHPDESKRPQSVTQLRAAIQGSERSDTVHAPTATVRARVDSAQTVSGARSASGASGGSGVSGAASRRNLLCTIMFLDLVGYSVRSVDDQVAIKKLFNELIGKALRGVAEDSRIAIDTGDGAAICFMGDPEEALRSAMLLRDLLGARYGGQLAVRIGLHMGPVRVVSDLNERVNVVGDGINVAQRVMDFAGPGQVLVSRAYFDVISRITDDTAGLFHSLGPHEDKHARVHELYAVEAANHAASQRPGPATGYTQTLPVRTTRIDPEELHEIEAELARHIGPLARVLVRKAQALASTGRALREALAPSIQDAKARDGFLVGVNSQGKPGKTQPLSQPSGQPHTQPMSPPLSRPMSGAPGGPVSQPAHRDFGPSSQSAPLGPSPGQSMTRPGTATPIRLSMTEQEMALIAQTLSKFIGPMARMLVRKETTRHSNYKDFIVAVAAHVDQSAQREVFLQAIARALPARKT